MSIEFEERLWAQLQAATEREARRGRIRRATAKTRAAVVPRGRALAAGAVAVLVAAVAAVSGLHPQAADREQWRVDRFRVAGSELSGAATGFGSLWTYDSRSAAVLRVDPGTRHVLARFPLATALPSVAVAAGAGAVWAVPIEPITHGAPPTNPDAVRLTRIDPDTDRITARVTLRRGDGSALRPVDVVAGAGAVWVWGRTGALRIDVARNRVATAIGVPGEGITGFVATKASVSVFTDLGRLVSFDARTGARLSSAAVPIAIGNSQKLVASGGGVVVYVKAGSLASVDPLTGRTRWTADVGYRPRDVAATTRRVWLLLSTPGRDQLRALDPATGREVARVTLPADDVRAITVTGDRILATTEAGGVIAVRPR